MKMRLGGIVVDENDQRLALIRVDDGDTIRARIGDTFELDVNGEDASLEVIEIKENSVTVRFRHNGKTKVIR